MEITRGIAQVFGELGDRENRWTARMRYLVQELGPEGFREELEKRVSVPLILAGLEVRPLDKPDSLHKLDALDKKVAFNSLKRAFDPDAPLFIDYEEHLSNYVGTDRAPVDHEVVRY